VIEDVQETMTQCVGQMDAHIAINVLWILLSAKVKD